MTRKYYDKDADLADLRGQVVAVLGYGNQGRSQALNLRDSGVEVLVGSGQADASEEAARKDGFEVFSFAACADRADILMLLLPDEILPQLYCEHLFPRLRAGQALCFASGYNVYYKAIELPVGVDVVLLAPRMIGRAVRELFVKGGGAPALIAVEQDGSGRARQRVLALAKGIGATRSMALDSSFEEETVVDLLGEQAGGGAMIYFNRLLCEVLIEAGCSPEAALLEVYASGENIAVSEAINQMGLWGQLHLHSHTSQYGHQTRGKRFATEETRELLRTLVKEVRSGAFHREWSAVQKGGMREFKEVWAEGLAHPVIRAEESLYRELGRKG